MSEHYRRGSTGWSAKTNKRLKFQSANDDLAVVRSVSDYETAEEKRAFMRAVVAGLADLEFGREVSLADAMARLGRK
jgi:hypothetical protein